MCWTLLRDIKEAEADGRRTSGSTNGRTACRPRILKDRPIYGRPMMDMALGLAPTNEMGVVFLFGTVAKELGFMVVRLQAEFPDCEAFRLKWTRDAGSGCGLSLSLKAGTSLSMGIRWMAAI